MEEVGLRDTVDPLAGSYFIETLTKQMEAKIIEEMQEVQKAGGMRHAVATGHIQRKVSRQAYDFEKGVQNGEFIKVGVNKYTDTVEDQPDVELHAYDESWAEKQIEGLKELRRVRDNREVSRTLKDLEQAARTGKNVMLYLVACCRAYATVGEMAGVFRQVFGEWEEPSIF
jgi:methylmalonyl-CoA mutase N-terminal domain/subunit